MEREYYIPSILSAILMTLALLGAGIGWAVQDWYLLGVAGIVALVSIGWAVLSLREVLEDE